jgi:hypothetical protein
MKRKAVIVGIADYGKDIPELPSSETEAEEWKNLLTRQYEFQSGDVRMVCGKRATKLAIMERLEWLLTDVQDHDQLFFSFHGHGVRLMRRNPSGDVHDEQDEAIVAYPEADQDVEQHSLYDDDVARLVLLSKLPPYANLTFVLDCCYSGGFSLREPDQPAVFVPRDIDHRRRDLRRRRSTFRFGEFRRLPSRSQNPVTIAAARDVDQSLLSEELDRHWRSVFSFYALQHLQFQRSQSYQELADSVKPQMLERKIENAPVLGGNPARFHHQFLQ